MNHSVTSLLAMIVYPPLVGQVPATLAAQDVSQVEQQIALYVDAHNEDAIALLERIVNINSGTMNPEGVQEVGSVLRAEFDALGFATRWISLPETDRGGHLFPEMRGGQG
jgi:glutamate carboxypeptidase